MSWHETARAQAERILSEFPMAVTFQQKARVLNENCPYRDPIKVRAWKAMVRESYSERPKKQQYSKLGLTPEQQEWLRKQS